MKHNFASTPKHLFAVFGPILSAFLGYLLTTSINKLQFVKTNGISLQFVAM